MLLYKSFENCKLALVARFHTAKIYNSLLNFIHLVVGLSLFVLLKFYTTNCLTSGNSIKTVLEVSTLIMRKKRKFFCTGEVKEPIVNNKIICKVLFVNSIK